MHYYAANTLKYAEYAINYVKNISRMCNKICKKYKQNTNRSIFDIYMQNMSINMENNMQNIE